MAAFRAYVLSCQRPAVHEFIVNQFVYLEHDKPFYAKVTEHSGKTAVLRTLKDYNHQKNNIWGITARNREQNFALNLLMNPEVDLSRCWGRQVRVKPCLHSPQA